MAKLWFLLLALGWWWSGALTTVAAADFQTEIKATYTFWEAGQPKAQFDFKLTNTTPTLFGSNYRLIIPEGKPSGLVVSMGKQEITREQKEENDQLVLDLSFANEVVGQGKSR